MHRGLQLRVSMGLAARTVRCMSASVSRSTDEVASSRMTRAGRMSSARARQSSWRWPCEKLTPPSATASSRLRTACAICTRCSATHSCSGLCRPSGSRFEPIVPVSSMGSCEGGRRAEGCGVAGCGVAGCSVEQVWLAQGRAAG